MKYNKDDIVNIYESGKNSSEICKLLGCHRSTVERTLKKNHIKTRRRSDYCDFDKYYLDRIDTEEKAYFLGFMYADGYNQESNGTARIVLQLRDMDFLNKLAKLLNHAKKASVTRLNQSQICFCSRHFTRRLAELGCIQNKSFKIIFPKWLLNTKFVRHFIRGYFDGDGCLYFNKELKKPVITIVSTNDFCKSLQQISKNELSIIPQKLETHPNHITKRYRISGKNKCLTFLNWLYQDATIYMDRKYQKYLLLKNILSLSA